jgi:tetratricopeptide (TPR) repeat protein
MPAKKKTSSKQKFNYKNSFIHYIYCLAIITLLIITGVNINNYLNSQKVLGASVDISPLQNEKVYWQNIVNANPTFVDGYLQLAKVEVELGNTNEATNFIAKALSLDPNSSKITSVQKELGL